MTFFSSHYEICVVLHQRFSCTISLRDWRYHSRKLKILGDSEMVITNIEERMHLRLIKIEFIPRRSPRTPAFQFYRGYHFYEISKHTPAPRPTYSQPGTQEKRLRSKTSSQRQSLPSSPFTHFQAQALASPLASLQQATWADSVHRACSSSSSFSPSASSSPCPAWPD